MTYDPLAPYDYSSITPDDWREICAGVKQLQDQGVIEPATWSPDRNPPPPEVLQALREHSQASGVREHPGKAESPRPAPRESDRRRASAAPRNREADASRSPGAIGTVRYPRLVPKDDQCAKELKKRTLTNLYNQRPAWLDLAHKKLDAAVFAAYGWPEALSDDELLAGLLERNLAQAGQE